MGRKRSRVGRTFKFQGADGTAHHIRVFVGLRDGRTGRPALFHEDGSVLEPLGKGRCRHRRLGIELRCDDADAP